MRSFLATVVVVGCVLLLIAGCGGSSKRAVALAFVSSRDGAYQLYTMSAGGHGQRRLTRDKGDASTPAGLDYQVQPAWSPDGTQIAFASSREGIFHIFLVDAAGKSTSRVSVGAQPDFHPSWSPDGRRLAVARGTKSVITVFNRDGSHSRRITTGKGLESDPAWSPDGRWIAYDRRDPARDVREIWLVHPDGSDRHPLTAFNSVSVSPSWSPDNRRIAFVSDRVTGVLALYTMSVDGRGLELVARSDAEEIDPAWSGDGKSIAFSRDGAIVTITPAGEDEHSLTDSKNNDSSPAWKPNSAEKT
jgi:TolB protein